jgi:hypothetical protein
VPSTVVSITKNFAKKFGLPFATAKIIAIASGIKHIQHATLCAAIFDGSEVALTNVTSMPSIIASEKNILCTPSFFFGINIKSEVIMNENTIIISRINIALKAIMFSLFVIFGIV